MLLCYLIVLQLWTAGVFCIITKYGIPMNLSEHDIDEMLNIRQPRALPPPHKVQPQPGDCADDAVVLEHILHDYEKFKIPGGGHVKVDVEIWVQEVSKIIEITSEFELDIYVTEMWTGIHSLTMIKLYNIVSDPSLVFNHMNPCKHNISVDGAKVLDRIWNPSSCFVNSKSASVHRSPFSNIFLQIYSNGSVWHNYRVKLTGPCVSTLRTFPIDQQKCMLYYESFTHNYGEVQMEWTNSPITILKQNITLPDYVLVEFKASSIHRLYPPGLWNELVATFIFARLYGFYVLQVYIPAYISVVMSWISFYLGPKNTPSRTTIGVNALLSLTYQFGTVVNNLPKTSDVKAIDVMILVSMAYIFLSLLELAIVGYLTRKEDQEAIKCECSWLCFQCPQWTAAKIDKASSFIFPVSFFIFNMWYWLIFLGRIT